MTNLDSSKAQALLQSAQELRMHWSGLITNVMYFTIVVLVAVWTIFIQAYFENFATNSGWAHAYIVAAFTISAVVLVISRWYTQYLDNNIACLYPELIYLEGKLSCPTQYGTNAYLRRSLGDSGKHLDEIEDIDQKAEVVGRLVKKKLIGGRGHDTINLLVFLAIFVLGLISFGLGIFEFIKIGGGAVEQGILELKWLCGIFSGGAIIGMVVLLAIQPKKPCEQQITEIVEQVSNPLENKSTD